MGEHDQALFKEVHLVPSVDFYNLEEVFVLKSGAIADGKTG